MIAHISAQELDIYGYFEPQYMGIYKNSNFYQTHTNKLRVDLKSNVIENIEFGADVIHLLYFGKKNWNILDFLPDRIQIVFPEEMYSSFQFTYQDSFFLDNAYVRLSSSRFALMVGKQQISLGTGYFSNPIDVFNIKNALDPTYEQSGHNAIRMDLFLSQRLSIMVIYSPLEMDWQNSGKLVRLKAGIGHFDVSITGNEIQHVSTDFYTFQTFQQRRRLLGLDFVGELIHCGIWGEGAYNFMELDDDFYEFIIGTDYTFESGLYTMLEYHHNSQAKSDYLEYDLNDWMHLFTGETKTISRNQVYGFIRYPLTDLTSIGGSIIVSVSDKSVAFVPTVNYSLFENVDLMLMGNFYIGNEGKTFSSLLGNSGFLRATVYF
jgi:hypothetical protein